LALNGILDWQMFGSIEPTNSVLMRLKMMKSNGKTK